MRTRVLLRKLLSLEGTHARRPNARGTGRHSLDQPLGLAVPGTRVYVADFPNNLVRVIDIADATVSIFEGTGAAIPTPPTRARRRAPSLQSRERRRVDRRLPQRAHAVLASGPHRRGEGSLPPRQHSGVRQGHWRCDDGAGEEPARRHRGPLRGAVPRVCLNGRLQRRRGHAARAVRLRRLQLFRRRGHRQVHRGAGGCQLQRLADGALDPTGGPLRRHVALPCRDELVRFGGDDRLPRHVQRVQLRRARRLARNT